MFVGHWAPALAAATRPRAPRLVTLFIAAQLVDWAFFAFLLIGAEHMRMVPGISAMNPMDLYDMPWTHSLLGSTGFAVGFAALVWLTGRDRAAALLAGAVVLSHWMLDLLVHVPDLTLAGSPPKLGLGLWNHPLVEMPLELGITLGALWLYARKRKPRRDRVVALAAVLLVLQAVNWFGGTEPAVTPMTSYLAFIAYGIATLMAWWMGKSEANPVAAG